MIIDCHAHAFPFLGDATGFKRASDHFDSLQAEISHHHQPVRRTADNSIVPHTIWSATDPSPTGREEVNFRVGRFGRFEWTKDGVDYYKQYMPPSLQDNACSADYLIAEMDFAGVDFAILQNGLQYGWLNDFFGECVRCYPDRFQAAAHVDESSLDSPQAMDELHRLVDDLGLRGLWVDNWQMWLGGYRRLVDDPHNEPFWTEVERLGLVVYWAPGASPLPGLEGYVDSIRRWCNVIDRHPRIRTVVPNGLSNAFLFGDRQPLPAALRTLLAHGDFYVEILFPIRRGGIEEYPYSQSLDAAKYLYDNCGPRSLVWGSDMPNVLRHCTYRQSLEYLRRHTYFIPASDMDLIVGGNMARLFRLTGAA